MSLHDELKARNAKPGDRVVCEDAVYIVASDSRSYCLLNMAGEIFWIAGSSLKYENFRNLLRPEPAFWNKEFTTTYHWYYKEIDPIIPKKKITIEVEEGAEVIVNGRRVEV